METDKKIKSNSIKKEKIGADGLTKKERRALKVQSRQQEDNMRDNTLQQENVPLAHDKLKNTKPDIRSTVAGERKKSEPEIETTPVSIKNSPHKQLTEKELRKLEWEKKLSEKLNESPKDNLNTLSKAELKAKRREQQEVQRLTKTIAKPESNKLVNETKDKKAEVKKSPKKKELKSKIQVHKAQLVQHLYTGTSSTLDNDTYVVYRNIHPAFVKLGVQYLNKQILGSNARCLALLSALKHLIDDLQTPPKQEFCRYLESVLQTCVAYVQTCRPFAVSMTNALRHFKLQLTQINTNLTDIEKKARLQDVIDVYINDDIKKAGDAISLRVNEKITDGDVILTYGCSSLIKKILLEAHKDGKKFEVLIVDSRPLLEGKEMIRRLAEAGIKCTYVLITAVSYVMSSISKVILGAHALLTNGYVMSRIGTAQVALVAQAYNRPVLVCCETYKFSERVQTDSFVYNEIDDPDKLTKLHISDEPSPLSNWKESTKLTPLNLLYDVTPPDLVTAVVTELAILPCTSVPVVLRINANEIAY